MGLPFRECAQTRSSNLYTSAVSAEKLPTLLLSPVALSDRLKVLRNDLRLFDQRFQVLYVEANCAAKLYEWDLAMPNLGVWSGQRGSQVLRGLAHGKATEFPYRSSIARRRQIAQFE